MKPVPCMDFKRNWQNTGYIYRSFDKFEGMAQVSRAHAAVAHQDSDVMDGLKILRETIRELSKYCLVQPCLSPSPRRREVAGNPPMWHRQLVSEASMDHASEYGWNGGT